MTNPIKQISTEVGVISLIANILWNTEIYKCLEDKDNIFLYNFSCDRNILYAEFFYW